VTDLVRHRRERVGGILLVERDVGHREPRAFAAARVRREVRVSTVNTTDVRTPKSAGSIPWSRERFSKYRT
jgi:hypothetical protein